jgi:hypothetical protein
VVAHAFNPSTREAWQADFWVRGQPGLQSELQDSQGYTEKPCLEKPKKKKKKKKKKNSGKLKKNTAGGWRDDSVVKGAYCSSKGPKFKSQQPHGGSQPSVTKSDALFWSVWRQLQRTYI